LAKTKKLNSQIDNRESIKREIKITLNKLCPSNIEILKPKLVAIGKISLESLFLLIESIFMKSTTESKYTSLYALLCKNLSKEFYGYVIEDKNLPIDKKKNLFKCLLLNHLQYTFEIIITLNQISHSSRTYSPKDFEKNFGYFSFAGGLFKHKFINQNIMQEIINKLLSFSFRMFGGINEENIELLCTLILNAGKIIKYKRITLLNKNSFSYFNDLLNEKISLRLRRTILVNYI
jgi:hypothetical protein